MPEGRPGWWIGLAIGAMALAGAISLQLAAVERRMVAQGRQLQALGQATEKLAQQLARQRTGPPVATGRVDHDTQYAQLPVRHPELPNFLTEPQKTYPAPAVESEGTVSIDFPTGDPKVLNTITRSGTDVADKLSAYVEASLGDYNRWTDPNTYSSDLAWRLEVADEYRDFTFYLRRGVKWHRLSGVDLNSPRYAWLNKEHEVTAHDIAFFLQMVLDPQVQNGSLKNYYSEVESYEALDDYTFHLRWKKTQALNVDFSMLRPLPEFLYAYTEDGQRIPDSSLGLQLNQHWYNHKGLPGCGPYRFAEYVPGSHIVLERNDEYYGQRPAIKTIRYPIYTDSAQTVLKLKSGELTFGELTTGQFREEVLQHQGRLSDKKQDHNPFVNGDIVCDKVARPVYRFIGWNADHSLFSDRRTRRAMTLSTNREQFVENVISGLGNITNGPFAEGSPYFAPDVQALPFDLAEAAEMLFQAGWSDSDGNGILDRARSDGSRQPFEFGLMILASRPEYLAMANILKEDLLSLGVRMRIEAVDWSLMLKRLDEKDFDAYLMGWGLTWSTDPYQIWHSSQADIPKGSNRVGFRNAEADALIEKLRVTLDEGERTTMLRQFHRIVHAEQPYTFLFVPQTPYCYRKFLKNVEYSKVRPIADLRTWWVETDTN